MSRTVLILIVALSFAWTYPSTGDSPSSTQPSPTSSAHWAFQRLHKSAPPLPGHPVDAFIRAKHRTKGLAFAEQASARELLRRASLQLTGIPISSEESLAMEKHFFGDSFQSAVSQLLESPRFGERWARWWLDVARYADSNGQDENKFMGQAWRYRDWVIGAFNNNLPFDQFTLHQLAGDLLPTNNVSIEEQHARLIATGFLVIGPKMLAEQDKPKLVLDIVDEQIDTVGRAFLGLTLQCARCHDHKFDPVTAHDYHALAGIFKSTRTMKDLAFVSSWNERSISTDIERAALRAFQDATNKINSEVRSAEESANQEVHEIWRSKAFAYARASAEWKSLEAARRTTNSAGEIALKAGLHLPTLERWTSVNRESALAGMEADVQSIAEEAWTMWNSTEARVFLSPGRLGSAGLFKGRASLSEPHRPELEPSSLTLQVWVHPLAIPMGDGDKRRWLIGKNDNEWAQGHYSLFLEGTTAGAYLNIGGGPDNVIITRGPKNSVPSNQWTFLAMSYDGSELRLYTNGFLSSAIRPSKPRQPGSGNLTIGKRGDGHRFFEGKLDQAALYSRARDDQEIADAFLHPEDRGEKPTTGLIRQWAFEASQPQEEHEARLQQVAELFYGPSGLLSPPSDRKPFWSKAHQDRVAELQARLQTQLSNAPLPEAFAMAVEDSKPEDLPVYARGSHLSPGKETIPRNIPAVLRTTGPLAIAPGASGRLEFANWLVSPANPLVSRVTVNRIWQALFGQGLVPSSDNFGIRGDPPSHPELLDWLAAEFVETGWDFKRLLRTILSSQTYQQSSRAVGTKPAIADGDVNSLTMFPRQRMEAEMIRDSILALSGQLDPSMGGSMVSWKNNEYVPGGDVTPFDKPRRSIYLPVIRDRMQEVFTLFDAANPSVGCSRRAETTAPHQALFFMNSPLVKSAAKEIASRLLQQPGSETERIGQAYRMLFNRTPSESELMHCLKFLRESSADGKRSIEKTWAALAQALCASNEFVSIE